MTEPQNPPTSDPQKPPAAEPEKHEVKAGGEVIYKTLEELKADSSKVSGADKLMREAAEIRKQGAFGIEIAALKEAMETGQADEQQVRRWGQIFGMDPEDTQAQIDEIVYRKPPPAAGNAQAPPPAATPQKISLADLDDSLRNTILTSHTTTQDTQRENFRKDVEKILDKHEQFVNITKDLAPEARDQMKKLFIDEAQNEANRRMSNGRQTYNSVLVQDVANYAADKAQMVSKLVAPKPVDITSARPESLLVGFGGTGAVTGVGSQTDKPIQMPAVSDPDYDRIFAQKFMQHYNKATRRNK